MWIALILALPLISCSKKTIFEKTSFKEVEMSDAPKDQNIPTTMWDEIQGNSVDPTQSLRFLPVAIYFIEKTPGVIGGQNLKIRLGRGGGELDLARIVKPDHGTYILGMQLETDESLEDLKVFFLSRTKKRSFEGKLLGAGCSTYLDITEYFKKNIMISGVEVNTFKKRHVTLTGGTFIFSFKKPGYHFLSQVTFTDSDSTALFCDPLVGSE